MAKRIPWPRINAELAVHMMGWKGTADEYMERVEAFWEARGGKRLYFTTLESGVETKRGYYPDDEPVKSPPELYFSLDEQTRAERHEASMPFRVVVIDDTNGLILIEDAKANQSGVDILLRVLTDLDWEQRRDFHQEVESTGSCEHVSKPGDTKRINISVTMRG